MHLSNGFVFGYLNFLGFKHLDPFSQGQERSKVEWRTGGGMSDSLRVGPKRLVDLAHLNGKLLYLPWHGSVKVTAPPKSTASLCRCWLTLMSWCHAEVEILPQTPSRRSVFHGSSERCWKNLRCISLHENLWDGDWQFVLSLELGVCLLFYFHERSVGIVRLQAVTNLTWSDMMRSLLWYACPIWYRLFQKGASRTLLSKQSWDCAGLEVKWVFLYGYLVNLSDAKHQEATCLCRCYHFWRFEFPAKMAPEKRFGCLYFPHFVSLKVWSEKK